jgi:AP-1 complex subunit beta-1
MFVINDVTLQKLLAALNECTEWGQTCILTSLANYKPKTPAEAADIVERVIPRLQHVNASVVLAAVKVLLIYMECTISTELKATIVRKLAPPLVTLLSTEPEIQFVALRNINLILQKRPEILKDEIRIFFTKYNDPPYVKLEKLDIIVKLASESNIEQVLSELKE